MTEKAKKTAQKSESETKSASQTRATHSPAPAHSPAAQILCLQRTVGNQAVQRLLRSGVIQTKLKVSQPNDKYEQEADRVAEEVMRMPEPQTSPDPEKGPRVRLQAKQPPSASTEVPPELESRIQSLKGGGQPLAPSLRAFFGSRFGLDFSQVRVHTNSHAVELARDLNARSFTVGQNIAFGAGQFAPGSMEGKRLLAHELTHVVKQQSDQKGFLNCDSPHDHAQLSPASDRLVWKAFRISGERGGQQFVNSVLRDLKTIYGRNIGKKLIEELTENRSGFFRNLIKIEKGSACGYTPAVPTIVYKLTRCVSGERCGKLDEEDDFIGWNNVDNFVYLFHELVHAYLDLILKKNDDEYKDCRCIGLGHFYESIEYNENKLRNELKLPFRPCHDGHCIDFPPPRKKTKKHEQ